jgi:nucleotide-binding universal stress UspA family protein
MSGLFARVLCGDDGTAAAREAALLACRLLGPGARLEVVRIDGQEAQHGSGRRHGGPAGGLLRAISHSGATLAVVPAPAHSRAVGITSGAVPTFVLHEAPCSVLVARARPPGASGGVIVGVDGSPESIGTLAAGRTVALRLGLPLRAVTATGDAHVNLDAARRAAPGVEEHHRNAVDLLAHLSEDADLLVVGSRGLKGVRSLGSVSERVAHEARCPVLVVRVPQAASAAA